MMAGGYRTWLVILIIVLICVLWNRVLKWAERVKREEEKMRSDEYLARSEVIEDQRLYS